MSINIFMEENIGKEMQQDVNSNCLELMCFFIKILFISFFIFQMNKY